MSLKATTVRLSDELWGELEREASSQGVSVAQFLRDCALLRLGQLSAKRGDAAAQLTVEHLAKRSLDERRSYPNAERAERLADPARLAALAATALIDRPVDPALERLANLAAKVLAVPTVLISLVEHERQYFAAHCGLGEPWGSRRETGMSHSFCQEVVISRQPFVVSDAREHPVMRHNLAIRDLGVIAYAGIPLTTPEDQVLGSFCAIDRRPRVWTGPDLDLLREFAGSAMAFIEGRSKPPVGTVISA